MQFRSHVALRPTSAFSPSEQGPRPTRFDPFAPAVEQRFIELIVRQATVTAVPHQTDGRFAQACSEPACGTVLEPVPAESILEVLRLMVHTDAFIVATLRRRSTNTGWAGRLREARCEGAIATVAGHDAVLHWAEDVPGQRSWLERSPTARGLRHALHILVPDTREHLRMECRNATGMDEPCAWRQAIAIVAGEAAGHAC